LEASIAGLLIFWNSSKSIIIQNKGNEDGVDNAIPQRLPKKSCVASHHWLGSFYYLSRYDEPGFPALCGISWANSHTDCYRCRFAAEEAETTLMLA
jgi:hypothetical protein